MEGGGDNHLLPQHRSYDVCRRAVAMRQDLTNPLAAAAATHAIMRPGSHVRYPRLGSSSSAR